MPIIQASQLYTGPKATTEQVQIKRQGTYRGQLVHLQPSATSLLNNAMEEIAELVADRIEEEYKKKEKGHVKKGSPFEKSETVRALMENMRDEDFQQKLKAFTGKLTRMRGASLGRFNAELETQFADVTHRFIALHALKEQLKKDAGIGNASIGNAGIFKDYAERALKDLTERHGEQVWAGLNIQKEVAQRGHDPVQRQEMRDFYRETVLHDESLVSHYHQLVERYGDNGLSSQVDFLIKALGSDISAENPSRDKRSLKAVLDELYQLETLVTLHDGCQLSLNHLHSICPEFAMENASSMMKELLTLVGREWMDKSHVGDFLRHMKVEDAVVEINILRESRRLVERLPAKAYANVEQRQKIIQLLMEAQDDAIDHEDEMNS